MIRATIYEICLKLHQKAKSIIRNYFWMPYLKKNMISLGNKVFIGDGLKFVPGHLEIGDDVFIGEGANLISSISTIHIGSHVMLAPNVTIRGGDHRFDIVGRYIKSIGNDEKLPQNDQDVYIEDDVWIGCNVTILKGVRIGRGSVVGAGSIVIRDIPPYTIHVGCPEVKEFKRFTDDQIKEHEALLDIASK